MTIGMYPQMSTGYLPPAAYGAVGQMSPAQLQATLSGFPLAAFNPTVAPFLNAGTGLAAPYYMPSPALPAQNTMLYGTYGQAGMGAPNMAQMQQQQSAYMQFLQQQQIAAANYQQSAPMFTGAPSASTGAAAASAGMMAGAAGAAGGAIDPQAAQAALQNAQTGFDALALAAKMNSMKHQSFGNILNNF